MPAYYHRRWTPEEEQYIRDHWQEQTDAEMAAALDRLEGAVRNRRRALRCSPHKSWTPEEEEYLEESWGSVSIPTIAKNLGRTVPAITVRAERLGLGAVLDAGDYITLNQLLRVITGGAQSYSQLQKSWVQNRGMPVHTRRVNKCSWRIVYLDEFWKWAEKHRSFIDFSKLEPLALGKEPAWVQEQRSRDFKMRTLNRKDPWTPDEDSRLIRLIQQHKYGYAEISAILHRSEGAITRRCRDLGLKERPVRADNHGENSAWTAETLRILADGIRHGDSYQLIGLAVGKSEKAVRGKVWFTYLTENADKVRAMLADGPWGFGAPVPTVKQGFHHSKTRSEVKKDLSKLDTLLRKRQADISRDPHFWQRRMCKNWGDTEDCAAGIADCDSCPKFRRIPPQYCSRCGDTFYERQENRFCKACRTTRKK